jgi:hypothetical protein
MIPPSDAKRLTFAVRRLAFGVWRLAARDSLGAAFPKFWVSDRPPHCALRTVNGER